MLKFTRKTEYALMAIKYMQTKPVYSITTAKEISDNINIPFQNLSKILQFLKNYFIILSQNMIINTLNFINIINL